jgi:FkbM family methyltransferase
VSSQAEKDAIRGIISGWNNPVIVELGAHLGEESKWIAPLVNHPRYVMVEPDWNNFQCMRRNQVSGSELFWGLIAGHNGTSCFYASENHTSLNRASGSIRKPSGHLKHFPEVTFEKKSSITCWTLDDFCREQDIGNIDLLWCDIQGAERDMIQGGRKALRSTHYMMIEAEPEVELYEGQALKPELLAMLPDWKVLQDFGYNVLLWNTKYA